MRQAARLKHNKRRLPLSKFLVHFSLFFVAYWIYHVGNPQEPLESNSGNLGHSPVRYRYKRELFLFGAVVIFGELSFWTASCFSLILDTLASPKFKQHYKMRLSDFKAKREATWKTMWKQVLFNEAVQVFMVAATFYLTADYFYLTPVPVVENTLLAVFGDPLERETMFYTANKQASHPDPRNRCASDTPLVGESLCENQSSQGTLFSLSEGDHEPASMALFLDVGSSLPCTRSTGEPLLQVTERSIWSGLLSAGKTLSYFVYSAAVFYVTFDLILFTGHWIMHKSQRVFRSIHTTHHNTYATVGLSGHYMDFWDFFLESILPFMACIVVGALLDVSKVASIAAIGIGGFNVSWVHSGWQFEGCPDPRQHFLHHVQYNVNFGIGMTDAILGTRK